MDCQTESAGRRLLVTEAAQAQGRQSKPPSRYRTQRHRRTSNDNGLSRCALTYAVCDVYSLLGSVWFAALVAWEFMANRPEIGEKWSGVTALWPDFHEIRCRIPDCREFCTETVARATGTPTILLRAPRFAGFELGQRPRRAARSLRCSFRLFRPGLSC